MLPDASGAFEHRLPELFGGFARDGAGVPVPYPDANRPFRCPGVPLVPILGVLSCLMLMFSLPWENWMRLFVWMAIGLVIYVAYGRRHSKLRAAARARR